MPAIKLSGFGGMVPAQDDLLLPENAAAYARNAWLYRGDLEGWRAPRLVRTLVSSTAKRVFRIPNNPAEIGNYTNSIWMEFQDRTTQVVRAPMLQDSYSRYYWVGADTVPTYNTLARIQAGQSAFKLGVPGPSVAPGVRASSGYILAADTGLYSMACVPAAISYGTYSGPSTRQRTMANIGRSSNVALVTTTVDHGYNVGELVQILASTYSDESHVANTDRNISQVSRASNVATVVTTAAHGRSVGESVHIGMSSNGPTAVATGTARTITEVSRNNGIATVTTSAAHGYTAGNTVRVASGVAGFDGDQIVTSVPSADSFTYTNSGVVASQSGLSGSVNRLTAGFNGRWVITAVPNSTTIQFNSGGENVAATNDDGVLWQTSNGFNGVHTITSTPSGTTFTFASTGLDQAALGDTGTTKIVSKQFSTNSGGSTGYGSYTKEPTDAQPVTEVRSYVYTYVSAYGEEGPPSDPTVRTGTVDGSWVLSIPTPSNTVTSQRNLTHVRIYRTITATNGAATYFRVDEIPIAQQGYTDVKGDDDISGNGQLESTYWTPPPEDLDGWVAMPNGILAGWRDNELWFCEPYRPHAWPVSYQVSVDFPIVGLGVMGQTLIVATEGSPWAASGVRPSTISLAKINMFEPCTSRLSIVSTPGGVLYSSPNGLVLAVPGQVQVLTGALLTPAKWKSLNDLTKLEAIRFGSAYLAYETPSTTQSKGFIIDPATPRIGYVPLFDGSAPLASIDTDPWTNDMLIIRNGGVYVVDQPDGDYQQPYLWRSKVFQLPYVNNLGAMKVYFDVPAGAPVLTTENTSLNQSLSANQYGLVRVYADDTLVLTRELRTSGQMIRLPSGFRANTYQFEIEARVTVQNIQIAPSARELRGV